MGQNFDFGGWATKVDIRCSDGLTIKKGAFDENDGQIVPLVWQHCHDNPSNVLGHALLEKRDEGTYAYCAFNDTELAQHAKELVKHGDISCLSIYANKLKKEGKDVVHGLIREVSLVMHGANPGAVIDIPVIQHDDGTETDSDEFFATTGESLEHTDGIELDLEFDLEHADDETIGDIFNSLNEKQKIAVVSMLYDLLNMKNIKHSEEGANNMKQNVFENKENNSSKHSLTHSEEASIFESAKELGSLKAAVLAHAEEGDYGIEDIEQLFPNAKNLNNPPEWVKRPDEWVGVVMNGVGHTPFSRIKTMFADITADEARAKGYIKGNYKKEEIFTLLKRETTPQTVYKKQKLDRDDIIDITDFDVVSWIRSEMRMMLEEEVARAILIGDGREITDEDKIKEDHIRPIYTDEPFYTIRKTIVFPFGATKAEMTDMIIENILTAKEDYRGSGNMTFFTSQHWVTTMLLSRDKIGRRLYKSVSEIADELGVSKIVTVPQFDAIEINGKKAIGLLVNLNDYKVGADKGGQTNMFDDFDIDYNQYKYLLETRFSGALIKPFSAIVIETMDPVPVNVTVKNVNGGTPLVFESSFDTYASQYCKNVKVDNESFVINGFSKKVVDGDSVAHRLLALKVNVPEGYSVESVAVSDGNASETLEWMLSEEGKNVYFGDIIDAGTSIVSSDAFKAYLDKCELEITVKDEFDNESTVIYTFGDVTTDLDSE